MVVNRSLCPNGKLDCESAVSKLLTIKNFVQIGLIKWNKSLIFLFRSNISPLNGHVTDSWKGFLLIYLNLGRLRIQRCLLQVHFFFIFWMYLCWGAFSVIISCWTSSKHLIRDLITQDLKRIKVFRINKIKKIIYKWFPGNLIYQDHHWIIVIKLLCIKIINKLLCDYFSFTWCVLCSNRWFLYVQVKQKPGLSNFDLISIRKQGCSNNWWSVFGTSLINT